MKFFQFYQLSSKIQVSPVVSVYFVHGQCILILIKDIDTNISLLENIKLSCPCVLIKLSIVIHQVCISWLSLFYNRYAIILIRLL